MELHLTKQLENLINSRGGEAYILKCIASVIGSTELVSLDEYKYVCKMNVTVYDLIGLWNEGCSPMDKLFGSSLRKVMEMK